jgi:hypothetical protein
MNYKNVKLFIFGINLHTLQIDNENWYYDIHKSSNTTILQRSTSYISNESSDIYIINTILELNEDNPKETLDKFFKLLMLQ